MKSRYLWKIRALAFLIFVIAMIVSAQSKDYGLRADKQVVVSKIAPWVLERTTGGEQAEFLVILADQADLSGAALLKTKAEKGRYVYETLWNKAQATQGPLLKWLAEQGIEHRSYYIVNLIWVKGDREAALVLAAREDVLRIEGNPQILNLPQPNLIDEQQPVTPLAIESGINFVRAPEVWSLGYTGQGIVVGGQDTGYRWDHAALIKKYRGWDGVTANHDYNWHDSIHTGGGSCGPNSAVPCDDNGHGTHTMGTVLGDDEGAATRNQVGMAPAARWIGCRNMNQGAGTPATYLECFEFFLAPYPVNGTPAQGDPTKAPDVTNNSWGCPPSEGCSANTLQAAVAAQRAAGIMTVVSAGNSGSSCSTVSDPPGIYDEVYSVGAFSSSTGTIASFSSRGPVTLDGSNRLKPDISAPGVSVRSSTRTSATSYGLSSGTSMAGPHVAGAVALLWSARPSLRNQVTATEMALNDSAVKVNSTLCNSPAGWPNNTYGFGQLDIKAAVDLDLATMILPASQGFSESGGEGVINVARPVGSRWRAKSSASWIEITSAPDGTGNGAVNFIVRDNLTGSARQGTITVAAKIFTIIQDGGVEADCTYTISPAFTSFSDLGGAGSLNVFSEERCSWQAESSASWIRVTSNCCGIGNGIISYEVAKNTSGAGRKGAITIGGRTFFVKQKAN